MAPQKRKASDSDSLLKGVKALLLDIEGTITPISFVKDTLFPYIEENLEKYLAKNFDNATTQKDITALRELAKKDKEAGVDGVVEIPEGDANKDDVIKSVCQNVAWQMSQDRKSTELKQLQGHVWKEAYESGAVQGELFDDVSPVLRHLNESGVMLYVFSSGSVESQKLFFQYSSDGDLLELFSGYFDSNVGRKTDSSSYKKIASEIGFPGEEILFMTDKPEEAEAAVNAGLQSALVIREGNEKLTDDHLQDFACIRNFHELFGDDYDDEDDDDDDIKKIPEDEDDEEDDDEDGDEGEGEEDDPEEV